MAVALFLGLCLPARAELVIASDSRSDHCILIASSAPPTVHLAARELQHFLRKAVGVQLPIIEADDKPDCPVISLGLTDLVADQIGQATAIPYDGFRIVTDGDDLFIFGPDTGKGERTPKNGRSRGTLNGVYSFLEEFLGIRWVLPGEMGEVVPQHQTLMIPELNRLDAPAFQYRVVEYVQKRDPSVATWLKRQKLGRSVQLHHQHMLQKLVPAEFYETRPEWFAVVDGEHKPPERLYHLELTNPDLIDHVVKSVAEKFRSNPRLFSHSISPGDGSHYWSESAASLALHETDPNGQKSMTPLVLGFYTEVAHRIAKLAPGHNVCGYIYAQYYFPPKAGIPNLPNNLCLVLAPYPIYAYGLYLDDRRKDFESVIKAWSEKAPSLAYYDLPNTFTGNHHGAPNPPGLNILSYLLPKLVDSQVIGVYFFGVSSWGQGGLTNYLLAKLTWDPTADVRALALDYLTAAYGASAANDMLRFNDILDQAISRFRKHTGKRVVRLDRRYLWPIFGDHLVELETVFGKAEAAEKTADQERRFSLLKANLGLFYQALIDEGNIASDRPSPWRQDVRAIRRLAQAPETPWAFAPCIADDSCE